MVEEFGLSDFGNKGSFVLEDGSPRLNRLNIALTTLAGGEETRESSGEVLELSDG